MIPKYTGQHCQVYSRCWAAVTTIHLQNSFLLAELKFGTHLNTKSQLSTNSLCPGSLYSTFCLCEFGHSRCRILVESYGICPLCLAYFTDCNILKVHACFCMGQNFLPFQGWVIFHRMDRPFIHSSISGNLGCLSLLSIGCCEHTVFWFVFGGIWRGSFLNG